MAFRQHHPSHPGRVLTHYLDMEHNTVSAVAKHLQVSRVTLSRLLNGKAGVSPEMAVRLGQALGTGPEMWITMQAKYELWQARKSLGKISIRPLVRHRQADAA
jgi:addiction module HigA family antidote